MFPKTTIYDNDKAICYTWNINAFDLKTKRRPNKMCDNFFGEKNYFFFIYNFLQLLFDCLYLP